MSQKRQVGKKIHIEKMIKEQKIVQGELGSLRKGAKVYRKQQNSNLFFVSNISTEMKKSKDLMDDLIREYGSLEALESETVPETVAVPPDDMSQ